MLKRIKDERGIAHVAIVIGILVLIAVAGLIIWRVSNPDTNPLTVFESQPECAAGDSNICKFLSSWSDSSDYKVVSTQTADGETSTSIFEFSNGGTRYHTKMEMAGGVTYETIGIDNVIYTKDASSDKWYKQTTDNTEEVTDDQATFDFNEEIVETEEGAEDTTEYKKLGTEQCGDLTCYKYQIITADNNDTTEFIWFDTKDYRLRKMSSESASSTSTQEFSYDNISIEEPSPVEEIGIDEVINPLTGEKMSIPSAESY